MLLRNICKIRSNKWTNHSIQNAKFCVGVVTTDVREKLRQKLLNVPYETSKLPENTYPHLKNPVSYEIKNTNNIGIIQSLEFQGQQLGQSLIRLLATLQSLKNNDAQVPHFEREKLLRKNQFWFTSLDENFRNEIYTKKFENKLMAYLYVDSGFSLCDVYAISRQEKFNLHEFCLGEIERLFVKQSFYGSKLIHSCFSNFFPSFQSIITQLILNRQSLQRLAWLGDAVLHTYVCQQILINDKIIPDKFQWYNSDAALQDVAKEMKFDDFIANELFQLSAPDELLASLMEALIGCFFIIKQDINLSCQWLLHSEAWIETGLQHNERVQETGLKNVDLFERVNEEKQEKTEAFQQDVHIETNGSVKEEKIEASNNNRGLISGLQNQTTYTKDFNIADARSIDPKKTSQSSNYYYLWKNKKIKAQYPSDAMRVLYCTLAMQNRKSLLQTNQNFGLIQEQDTTQQFSKDDLIQQVLDYFATLNRKQKKKSLVQYLEHHVPQNILVAVGEKIASMGEAGKKLILQAASQQGLQLVLD